MYSTILPCFAPKHWCSTCTYTVMITWIYMVKYQIRNLLRDFLGAVESYTPWTSIWLTKLILLQNYEVWQGREYSGCAYLSYPGHEERTWHIAWNPTKPLLASCSADKSVRLYSYGSSNSAESPDLRFSHITTIPTGHSKTVRALAWAPSGKTLATASFDSNIGIWEQEIKSDDEGDDQGGGGEWECASLLEGHETECKSVSYSSSGTLLASCSRDKTVWVWEGACHLIITNLIYGRWFYSSPWLWFWVHGGAHGTHTGC